jgi:hypothetical protein
VALDVFVHHFGSCTFNSLGVDAAGLLQKNLALFREKWGEREAAGYRLPGPPPRCPAIRPRWSTQRRAGSGCRCA